VAQGRRGLVLAHDGRSVATRHTSLLRGRLPDAAYRLVTPGRTGADGALADLLGMT
jgi:hypothetical protein